MTTDGTETTRPETETSTRATLAEDRAGEVETGTGADHGTAESSETDSPEQDFDSDCLVLLGQERPVDPRVVTVARWVGAVSLLIPAVTVLLSFTLGWLFQGIPGWLYWGLLAGWALPVVILGSLVWYWPAVHYRHLRYRVDRLGLLIRRGVLWRKTISVPTTRVQHTDVTQGPLQRLHGLATLTVHTAGTQGASIPLSGLSHETALALRDHLMPTR